MKHYLGWRCFYIFQPLQYCEHGPIGPVTKMNIEETEDVLLIRCS